MSIRDKPFPMQRGPAISWDVAEKVYAMYSALYGTQQSLERLAERGGFGWAEVEYIQAEYDQNVAKRGGGGARGRIHKAVVTYVPITAQPLSPETQPPRGRDGGG